MPQDVMLWITLLAGGGAIGAALVGLLVLRRAFAGPMTLTAVAGSLSVGFALYDAAITYRRVDAMFYMVVFSIAAGGGGYALCSSLLERLRSRDSMPSLHPASTGRDDAAVIVLACLAPQHYDPAATAEMLDDLANEGLIEPSLTWLPVMFATAKARYRSIGGGHPGYEGFSAVRGRLREALTTARVGEVTTATCTGGVQLAERVASLSAAGYRDIAIVELAVAESLKSAAAKRRADAMRPAENGVRVRYAAPLWDSERISNSVARHARELGGEGMTTGYVLLGNGQPAPYARRDAAHDEHEMMFLTRVRARLAESGVQERNIRLAWAQWLEPDVTSEVRHLAALGCRRVVVVPACFPLEDLVTRIDIPIAVRAARLDPSVRVIVAKAWSDDADVVEELRQRAMAALDHD